MEEWIYKIIGYKNVVRNNKFFKSQYSDDTKYDKAQTNENYCKRNLLIKYIVAN